MSELAVVTEHIRHLDMEAIAALTAPELACIMDDLAEQKAGLALIEDRIRDALDLKYGARARQRRAEDNKDTGVVRFEDNGFVVVADLPKRVKWDQAKLRHARRDHPHRLGRRSGRIRQGQARSVRSCVRELAAAGARAVHSRADGRDRAAGLPHRDAERRRTAGAMNSGGAARSARTGRQSFGARSTPRRQPSDQSRKPPVGAPAGEQETDNAGSHRHRR